jgi:hypothetical protein
MRPIIVAILLTAGLCSGGCSSLVRIDGGMRQVQPSIVNRTGIPLDVEYTSSGGHTHCRVGVAAGGGISQEPISIFPPSKGDWPKATVRQNGQEVRVEFGPKGWNDASTDRYEAKLIEGRLTVTPQ